MINFGWTKPLIIYLMCTAMQQNRQGCLVTFHRVKLLRIVDSALYILKKIKNQDCGCHNLEL